MQKQLHKTPSETCTLKSAALFEQLRTRRSVRQFSSRRVPADTIENALKCANTAPSGANSQPWHFTVVTDPSIKKEIRRQTEQVEHDFYSRKAPKEWLQALEPIGTDEQKPFLEEASTLIVVFARFFYLDESGNKKKTYYPLESTGIATGFLISALHQAGVSTLTHTPKPMSYLSSLCGAQAGLRPYMLLVAGYAHEEYRPPRLNKRDLSELSNYL